MPRLLSLLASLLLPCAALAHVTRVDNAAFVVTRETMPPGDPGVSSPITTQAGYVALLGDPHGWTSFRRRPWYDAARVGLVEVTSYLVGQTYECRRSDNPQASCDLYQHAPKGSMWAHTGGTPTWPLVSVPRSTSSNHPGCPATVCADGSCLGPWIYNGFIPSNASCSDLSYALGPHTFRFTNGEIGSPTVPVTAFRWRGFTANQGGGAPNGWTSNGTPSFPYANQTDVRGGVTYTSSSAFHDSSGHGRTLRFRIYGRQDGVPFTSHHIIRADESDMPIWWVAPCVADPNLCNFVFTCDHPGCEIGGFSVDSTDAAWIGSYRVAVGTVPTGTPAIPQQAFGDCAQRCGSVEPNVCTHHTDCDGDGLHPHCTGTDCHGIAHEHETTVLSAVDGIGAEPATHPECFSDPNPLCGTSVVCDPLDHHDHNDADGDGLGHEEDDPCPCDATNSCVAQTPTIGCFEADVNGDGVVGGTDLLEVGMHFGCTWR